MTAADTAFDAAIDELTTALSDLRTATFREPVMAALEAIDTALGAGGKVIIFGNGGSAADADHLAAEFVGRCAQESPPWAALALNVSPAVLTALANDYGYEQVFARQVRALASRNDVVIGLTTSGRSANVIEGLQAGGEIGAKVVALTGRDGLVTPVLGIQVRVPADSTARVQELHKLIGHFWATTVESRRLGQQ